MTKRSVPLIICLLVIAASAGLSYSEFGGQTGAVWRMGAGLRAAAIGNAVAGVSGDLWSLHCNPAGLAGLEKPTLGAEGLPMSMDRTLAGVAVGVKLPQNAGGIAASWRNASVTNNMGRDSSGNPTSEIQDSNNLFSLALGKELGEYVRVGVSIHAKYHILSDRSATGFGGDAGVQLGTELIRGGVVVQNILDRQRWDTHDLDPEGKSEHASGVYIVGVASKPWEQLLLCVQYETAQRQEDVLRAGLEWSAEKSIRLRGGYDDGELAVGGGIIFASIASIPCTLDYLWRSDAIGGAPSQGLGITVSMP